jgi:hypothetical protein
MIFSASLFTWLIDFLLPKLAVNCDTTMQDRLYYDPFRNLYLYLFLKRIRFHLNFWFDHLIFLIWFALCYWQVGFSPSHIRVGPALHPRLDHVYPYKLTNNYTYPIFMLILFVAMHGHNCLSCIINELALGDSAPVVIYAATKSTMWQSWWIWLLTQKR